MKKPKTRLFMFACDSSDINCQYGDSVACYATAKALKRDNPGFSDGLGSEFDIAEYRLVKVHPAKKAKSK